MAQRTEETPVYGYEDWHKFIDEMSSFEEMLIDEMSRFEEMFELVCSCNTCGGEGEVWERDYTGEYTLVPCQDCFKPRRTQ